MIARLAGRNLWRNRRRTLVTAASVAFGVWLAVLFVGTRQATYHRLLDASARTGLGTVTLASPAAFSDDDRPSRLGGVARLAELARATPGVEAAVARSLASAVVATATRSAGAQVFGIEPGRESAATSLYLAGLASGEPLASGDGLGCLIGELMAERLGLHVGSKLVYTTSDAGGGLSEQGATVRGLFRTGSAELDGHVLVVALEALRLTLGQGPDEASIVAVYPSPGQDPGDLGDRLARSLASDQVQVFPWQETQAELARYVQIDSVVYRLIVGFIAIIIASGILNTMMMNVTERRRELGIMLAVGLSPLALFTMVLLEASLIGLAGLALGIVAVTPFYLFLSLVGIDLTALLGDNLEAGGVAVRLIVSCRLAPGSGAVIALLLMLLTVAAAVFPAAKAALTVPVKTVRMGT